MLETRSKPVETPLRVGVLPGYTKRYPYPTPLYVTDVPKGSTKHVRFTEEAAIQDLRERAEKILAIRESEELAEEAVRLGRMVSSDAPLY